ncbi:E3 ubiquitin-protein ligase TM129 [Nematostella vectensis]|uniref:E3 ubiquitin-protein ligase TM129 n=1 Tax=Nematostella vectensis TaxID=45351 RepID=UPI002076E52D|nr:E3 ubiquitin-protein ligase TM129 [Nematostella vectensis]
MAALAFELYFTLAYGLVAMCFFAPPKEFVSAGLTIQNILSSYLGSEDMDFVGYHLRRTASTVLVHSCLPLGYYIGLGMISKKLNMFEPGRADIMINMCLLLCVGIAVYGVALVRYWSWDRWSHHPLCKVLASHGGPWRAVASSINIEFRRITKFTSIIGATKLFITDSWIVKCTAYKVHVAHKPDVHLSIIASEDHDISPENSVSLQFLNILVESINPTVEPFVIRLLSTDYGDLKDRLQAPIRNARNVIIHQSLSDRFLDAFRSLVEQNERFHLGDAEEPEPCIGCMQQQADIKLHKLCDDEGSSGDCVSCYCRPMWCLDCMGKWFASRQDQQKPETWLSSTCPCPTCRSVFCMLDVCKIDR